MTQQTVEKEKPGYKKTKLGWIPDDWEVLKIEEIAEIKVGRDLKENIYSKSFSSEYRFPVFSNSIENKGLYGFYCKEEFNAKALTIIGRGAGLGASFIREGGFGAIGRLLVLIPKSNYDHKFISYFINHKVRFHQESGGIPQLTGLQLAKYEISVPTFTEQRKISTCLTTWGAALDKLRQLIYSKQLNQKGLMQQLLTGKKRLPGFSGEWKKYRLKDIANRVNRKNKELDDTVVTISAQRGFVKQEDFFKKRVASTTLENYTLVHRGEYAYNKSYSQGYPMGAFKRLDDFEKAVVTTLYICFQLKDNVHNNFIKQYFDSGRMVQGLMRIAQEGGRAHGLLNIGLEDFFNLKLFLPEKKEQIAIAEILNVADIEIELLKRKKKLLESQKKGLMQQLLTGKKRINQ